MNILEIRIDTKKDSSEEIKKAIQFLQGFVEAQSEMPETAQGAFNMFGNDEPVQQEKPKEEKPSEFKITPVMDF